MKRLITSLSCGLAILATSTVAVVASPEPDRNVERSAAGALTALAVRRSRSRNRARQYVDRDSRKRKRIYRHVRYRRKSTANGTARAARLADGLRQRERP